ncbi:hypothetical protein, partial [Mycoplasmoides pneumoniae]|uniref:hypothetical protein n=1 Tax=Mycoplasmoides pneumoniae TaxID=2104 RepID=UPI001F34A817
KTLLNNHCLFVIREFLKTQKTFGINFNNFEFFKIAIYPDCQFFQKNVVQNYKVLKLVIAK